MCATLDGFRAYLIEHSRPGYRVLVGKTPRTLDTLAHPADGAIKIVPVTAGAGRGWGTVLAGIALIAIGYATGGYGLTFSEAWAAGGTTFAGYLASSLGTVLLISGISQLLSPVPKMKDGDRPERLPSAVFDGPVNTTAQGNPVPVCYGRLIVGSQVISAGMVVEEYAP
jgi:predicted phage tail protein